MKEMKADGCGYVSDTVTPIFLDPPEGKALVLQPHSDRMSIDT